MANPLFGLPPELQKEMYRLALVEEGTISRTSVITIWRLGYEPRFAAVLRGSPDIFVKGASEGDRIATECHSSCPDREKYYHVICDVLITVDDDGRERETRRSSARDFRL